jgi:serine/threonine-protein kinase
MPPEQARGLWDEVDGRSDLWAVGATMFTLLTGQLVHDGRTPNEQLLAAMTKPATELATALPGVSPAVAHLVDRALAFDREKRWPTAQRMQEALRHAYHDKFGKPITTVPGQFKVPPSVVNRTIAMDDEFTTVSPRLPTTNQPVEAPQPVAPARSASGPVGRPVPVAAVVAGIGVLVLVAGGVGGLFVALHRSSAGGVELVSSAIAAPSSAPEPTQVAAQPAWTVASTPSAPPTPPASVASPAAAMPTTASGEAGAIPPPTPTAASSAQPTARPPPARPGCNPPFITVGGKKKWKEECL